MFGFHPAKLYGSPDRIGVGTMHFVGKEGSILPCYIDYGRSLFVVKLVELNKFDDEVEFFVDGKDEYDIFNVQIVETTRRVVFLQIDCEYFDDSGSGDDSGSSSFEDDSGSSSVEEEGEVDSHSSSNDDEDNEHSFKEDCSDDDGYWQQYLL